MPKLNIFKPPYRNVDEVVLQQGMLEMIDCYLDEMGGLNARPGLWSWWSSGSNLGVDGLYWWKEREYLLAVIQGQLYVFTSKDSAPWDITPLNYLFPYGQPMNFVTTGNAVFMANGGNIIGWDGTNTRAKVITDENAPTHCSGLAYLSGRLIASTNGSPTLQFTEAILAADIWPVWKPATFRADVSPDTVQTIRSSFNELIVFGTHSTEFWAYTGEEATANDVPFALNEGSTMEQGCLSPHSIVFSNDAWYWINQNRKVIRLRGRSPEVISIPFDRPIQSLAAVIDCQAFALDRWVLFTFPTSDFTFVFDTAVEGWYKWSKWNQDLGNYSRYLGQNATFAHSWNTWFVGCRKEGRIMISHRNLMTDMFEPIRRVARSCHYDHGTMRKKRCNRLMLRIKRGV